MNSNRYITGVAAICILVLLCSGYPKKKAKPERKVLFVGNVITNAHDMTGTLQKMLDEQHIPVRIKESSMYGLTLSEHLYMVKRGVYWSNADKGEIPTSIKAIGNGLWEMVILQESVDNILIPEFRKYCAEPALKYLDSVVKRARSKTVLFHIATDAHFPYKRCKHGGAIYNGETYALPPAKAINAMKEYCSDSFRSTAEEYKTMQQVYSDMAKKTKATIAPVGLAYEQCKSRHPEINLYDGTESPSKQGAYLTACIFYRYIVKTKLTDVKYSADVNPAEAKKLRDLADTVPMN